MSQIIVTPPQIIYLLIMYEELIVANLNYDGRAGSYYSARATSPTVFRFRAPYRYQLASSRGPIFLAATRKDKSS